VLRFELTAVELLVVVYYKIYIFKVEIKKNQKKRSHLSNFCERKWAWENSIERDYGWALLSDMLKHGSELRSRDSERWF
jgi:hypothetical protein